MAGVTTLATGAVAVGADPRSCYIFADGLNLDAESPEVIWVTLAHECAHCVLEHPFQAFEFARTVKRCEDWSVVLSPLKLRHADAEFLVREWCCRLQARDDTRALPVGAQVERGEILNLSYLAHCGGREGVDPARDFTTEALDLQKCLDMLGVWMEKLVNA
jgi:hypothetical protein